MEISELKAEKRDVVGKESSKKLRQQGMVPAVVYSDGNAESISVNARDFSALTHSGAGTHVIVKLKVAGVKKQPNAIIKEVQYNPVKKEYFHIDFQEIALNEKITTPRSITVVGDSPGVKAGGVLEHHLWEIEIEGLPKNMPDHIEVDISELQIGDSIHASDIVVPDGVAVATDPAVVVLAVSAPRAEKVETEAVESIEPEAAAGAAAEVSPASE
jgi:large subunit ribosomal protein L25